MRLRVVARNDELPLTLALSARHTESQDSLPRLLPLYPSRGEGI